MNIKGLKTLLAAAALAALLSGAASAQQLIAWPIGGRPWMRLPPGQPARPSETATRVTLSGYAVEGAVSDQAAELTYRITFHNPTAQRLEGVLLMPIPADTALSGFQMTVGGKTMKGELLESGQAAAIYENIVRQMRDPGLLELIGERLLRARVFPIEPNADITVRLTASHVLHKSGGLASLTIPLSSVSASPSLQEAVSVALHLSTARPIRSLYSPDGRLRLRRTGSRSAEATFARGSGNERGDLSLFFSTQDDPLSAGVLAYREPNEEGTFLLSLTPHPQDAGAQAAPKDVVFIVDRSGSMEENGKIEQARQALSYCIKRLTPRDQLGIVDFATDFNEFEPRLVPATEENKNRALRYVERIEASGGTNIEAGLSEGLRLVTPSAGRMPLLFFMTDGLPTVGQTDVSMLLRQAQDRNKNLHTRVFTFGVGSDVNTLFLDKLAQCNRGTGDYVLPGENIEAKVSTLYQKVSRPALTDVSLSWEGIDVTQVYPRPINDLFYGAELVVMGRYRGAGRGRLIVTGHTGSRAQRFEFPVDLSETAGAHAFLPRLWAGAKVSHELDAIRLSGRADPEVVSEIVRLAKRYGIVTPYTSYLITEESGDTRRMNALALQAVRGMTLDAASSGFSGGAGVADRAQKASRMFGALSGAGPASAAAPMAAALEAAGREARQEAAVSGRVVAETKSIGAKTFYRRGQEWVDGAFEPSQPGLTVVELPYLDPEYFSLLRAHPELGRYLALGAPLTFVHEGVAYKILAR